ncbi:MAG TPA: glycosyltransferase [Tepidiformaceae bacterium]|nr:glycosyltransferase [Tepidiformaceae bacterium]
MFRLVDTAVQPLEPYRKFVSAGAIERIESLAKGLRGVRILQLNATPYGGGVAELLSSLVPLETGLGLNVSWGNIVAEPHFFDFTKRLHNALQGAADFEVNESELGAYLLHNGHVADAIRGRYDLVVVHDPQPLPTASLAGGDSTRWIWRVHIDMSAYNPDAWRFLRPYIEPYSRLVFTMPDFEPKDIVDGRVSLMVPAIDPLSPKNLPVPADLVNGLVRWFGVELDRPLLTQVSRFDPWKDPLGVIRVYRQLRERHPGLQLALLGQMALDDPEGWTIYDAIREEAADDRDIHVRTNFNGVGNIEVNAFQRHSDVVIQKSVREGFGLVVSETLWKGTPIVAGRTGGIPLQLENGRGGFLVEHEEEWVSRVDALLVDGEERRQQGERGRRWVQERFLITRLLEDELRLMADVLERTPE